MASNDCAAMRHELIRRGYFQHGTPCRHDPDEVWLKRYPTWGQCVVRFVNRTTVWADRGTFNGTTAVGGAFNGRTLNEFVTMLDSLDSLVPVDHIGTHIYPNS
jgi:hypothetical protein